MNSNAQCSVLLHKRSGEAQRERCSKPATHIRRIFGRVAVLCCSQHSSSDNVDYAEDGFIDLLELPPEFRRQAQDFLNKALTDCDRQIAEVTRRRSRLQAEAEQLAGMQEVAAGGG